ENEPSSKRFNCPSTTTRTQPAPADRISQSGRQGGASASSSPPGRGAGSTGAEAFDFRDARSLGGGARPASAPAPDRDGGPSRFHSPRPSAATRAASAQIPAVDQTSRKRLCGSRISSLAWGSL